MKHSEVVIEISFRPVFGIRFPLISILVRTGIQLCKPLLIRRLCLCLDMFRPIRAALDDLGAFVHTKVVAIFTQFAPQRINRDDKFSFHTPVQ